MEVQGFARLPRPVRRFAAQAPAIFYDAGLGWLFGHRFLLLTHRGRRTGRLHRTFVEVLLYDASSRGATVVSGTGAQADWYRNLQANPPVEVRIGRERYVPAMRFLLPETCREVWRELARRRPLEARLASWLGMEDKPLVELWPARPFVHTAGRRDLAQELE